MAAPSNQNYTVFNTKNVNDLREILENFLKSEDGSQKSEE